MEQRRADALALLALIALVTIVFADVLFLGQTFFSRDLHYHVPIKQVVREAMLSGHFPYWNRLLDGGQPLAANPAYELFYPPQWLLLLPFALGYKLHILLHVHLAAIGMYALARTMRLGIAASLFAGISFGLGGPVVGLAGSFLPFLFSLSWMPWIAAFAVRYQRERRPLDFALACAALAMQFLIGEPVVLLQTLGALFFAALFFQRRLVPLVFALALAAFLLAGVQTIPAVDLAADSVRAEPFGFDQVRRWSFPPARILEPFFPRFAGAPDLLTYEGAWRLYGGRPPYLMSIYAGLLTAVLTVAGLVLRRRGWTFVAVLLGGAYLLAMGSHTPLLRILYDAGLFTAIRYPEKFVLVGGFVAVLFAAAVFDELLRGDERLRRVTMLVAGLAAAFALIAGIALTPELFTRIWQAPAGAYLDATRAGWLVAGLRAVLLGLLLAMLRRPAFAARAGALLLLFLALDLLPVASSVVTRASDRYLEPPPLVASLPGRGQRTYYEPNEDAGHDLPLPGFESLLLMRNELRPYWPLAWGREIAIAPDFDSTNLRGTERFRSAALLARAQKAPAYPRQFMSMINATVRLARPDRRETNRRLREAGEQAILVDPVREPIAAPRYRFARSAIGCTSIPDCVAKLRNDEGAVLVPGRSFTPAPGAIEEAVEWPNAARLVVRASGNALFVTSVTHHKYWTATVDGVEVPIVPANLAFQSILVPNGRHVVVFRYRNPLVATGAAVTVATLLGLALFVAYDLRRAKADPQAEH